MRNIKELLEGMYELADLCRIWTMRNIKIHMIVNMIKIIKRRIWTMRNIKASCNEFLKSCPSVGFGQ